MSLDGLNLCDLKCATPFVHKKHNNMKYWATYTLLLQERLEIHAMKLPTYNFGAHVNASRGLDLYSYEARRAMATLMLSVTPSYNFIWFDSLWLVF